MRDRCVPPADRRAMSPVVGKAMEATLVVLYLGIVTAALYGGAVPEYRAAAGTELAERAAADAATDIERSIPPDVAAAETRTVVELPPTIAGEAYRVEADGDRLAVDHPNPGIEASVPLSLPDRVVAVDGTWNSGDRTVAVVTTTEDGLEVQLS
ncbi:uncharacterized protein NP_0154A [Natronomonas pharaonis DSM 2160]|uniref:Secreted glycoprotein n=1 Tax=Natronomonas pharaonis (strain ATCC 35678 / DSM 2160 / CIP 103997 / JCM 8858 / NBRC 14720 / NCIMB 2260 / Gabara) TaxID=348780 RepID=A0A1U7ETF2_NATPD|nr:hypothetical protein [Natronomonas pharaonis]CAI48168.1 uncharacterized protein NP_0154A [Natronomonas pharaonis DSM 2160]